MRFSHATDIHCYLCTSRSPLLGTAAGGQTSNGHLGSSLPSTVRNPFATHTELAHWPLAGS